MAKYKIIPSSRTIVQSLISIGHKAEKGVEAIEFDLTAWVETYGSGTLTVIMRRWGDVIPYPIALEIDENNKATWTLSDIDTAKAGMAYAQLNYIVGDEVVKKSDIYTFRVMDSLTGEGDPPEAYESWLEHLTHLAAEAMAEVLDIEDIPTDKTLTVDGGIADAKATGDALSALEDAVTEETDKLKADLGDLSVLETETKTDLVSAINEAAQSGGSSEGLTADIKSALLACFRNVVFTNDEDDYYQDLYDALYNKTLVGLEVSYIPSDVVFDTDTLDSLKNDLIVTAVYDDRTREILPSNEYTLSGTLDATPSVVTVRRNNVTTTFNVTVVLISQMTESVMISGYDSRNASNTVSAGPYCLKYNDVYIYDYSAYITGIKLKVQTAGILHIDVIPSSVVENNQVKDEWASRVNKAVITITSTGEQTVYFDRPFAIPNGYWLVIGRGGTKYGDDTCIWKYGSYGTQKGFCWHDGSSNKSLGIDVIIKGGAS